MYDTLYFVDAQEMARLHPATFEAPSEEELKEIKPGSTVKVCANQCERFWVQVTKVEGEKITGTADNDLVMLDNLHYGDEIEFEKKNVYSIFAE